MIRRHGCFRRRGFTLVELISTVAVLAVLSSVGALILFSAVDGYVEGSTNAQLHLEASVAMDRIVRELRAVDLDDAAATIAPDVETVGSTSVTYDDDGRVYLVGTDLMLDEDASTSGVLCTDVSAFSLQVFDESNVSLALPLTGVACDPIRRVEISLTLSRHGVTETLRTKVFLRSTLTGAGS